MGASYGMHGREEDTYRVLTENLKKDMAWKDVIIHRG
jgi:hypothetical protein